ncbi:MAG: flavodoxin family protein [Desulfobacterota bacterium]|nr:flavodoxin family protein [Thermodesulfobacteriota bacterium]
MKTILAINGSPRKKGTTAAMLSEVLSFWKGTARSIHLSDLTIGHCYGCLHCMKHHGVCVQHDDMDKVIDAILAADAVVIGSPNYYYCVSGLLKNMIDRSIAASYRGIGEYTGMEWHGWKPFVGKVCGFVICQAAFGGEKAEGTLLCFADYSGMTHVGTVIASFGGKTLDDFPDYRDEAHTLAQRIQAALQERKQ